MGDPAFPMLSSVCLGVLIPAFFDFPFFLWRPFSSRLLHLNVGSGLGRLNRHGRVFLCKIDWGPIVCIIMPTHVGRDLGHSSPAKVDVTLIVALIKPFSLKAWLHRSLREFFTLPVPVPLVDFGLGDLDALREPSDQVI